MRDGVTLKVDARLQQRRPDRVHCGLHRLGGQRTPCALPMRARAACLSTAEVRASAVHLCFAVHDQHYVFTGSELH